MDAIARANKETVLKWSAYVHDTNYEFRDGYPEEVERVLTRIAKSKKATALMVRDYTTNRVYRLYYGGARERKQLLDELYEKANAILAKTLRK